MISLVLSAMLAPAQVTYLRCDFPRASVLITADEGNSSVTVSLPSTGHVRKLAAAFTSTEVRFSDTDVAYVVNRIDLTVTRTVSILNSSDRAKCAIETPPARAF